jgi:hypothetical protein
MDAEAEDFRSFDIGVYPLVDDRWNARKSALKAVQYMASAVPFVMSPVGICATMGVPGETHLLATTDEEWLTALRRLLTDADCARGWDRAGGRFAEESYSLDVATDALANVFLKTQTESAQFAPKCARAVPPTAPHHRRVFRAVAFVPPRSRRS